MPLLILALIVVAVMVAPPVLGTLFVVGGLVAFVVGTIEYVTAAISGFTPYGATAHLHIDPPDKNAEDGADPAYRSYYAGPVLLDYRVVLARTFREVWGKVIGGQEEDDLGTATPRSMSGKLWRKVPDIGIHPAISYPCAIAVTVGLWAGALSAIAFVAIVSAVFAALLALLVLFAVATAGGSRVLEVTALWIRGITVECGTCHERAHRPIYRCPDCHAEHRRLLPGMSGVLHRTCACHAVLPTLLATGKSKLPAQCAECKAQLPIRGLTAPTVHIPVIAGPTAGKSVYMQTAVSRLMLAEEGFEFADERAKQEFETNLRRGVPDDPRRAVKTVNTRPRAYNVYVGPEGSRSRRLLYLYDPAGEAVESVDQLAESRFLKHTKGIVFIVDPFSLRQVRSETDRGVLTRVGASNTAPRDSLERFVEALREHDRTRGGGRIKIPIAVVLTKADALLDPSGATHPYAATAGTSRAERDAAVRQWLADAGQPDLLSSMDNQFTTVSYFVVSYQDARDVTAHESDTGAVVNDDPAAPLRWLLDRKAVR